MTTTTPTIEAWITRALGTVDHAVYAGDDTAARDREIVRAFTAAGAAAVRVHYADHFAPYGEGVTVTSPTGARLTFAIADDFRGGVVLVGFDIVRAA